MLGAALSLRESPMKIGQKNGPFKEFDGLARGHGWF
jgi:hypothetical protein